jgi:hypothetical protein
MNNNNNVFYNARSSQNEESLTHTHNKNAKRKEKEKVARSPSPNNNAVFYSPTDPSLTHNNNNNEPFFDAENIHNKIAIKEKEKEEKEKEEKEEKESREKESKERVARDIARVLHNKKIRNEIIGKEKNRRAAIKTARNAFRAGKNKIRNERTKKRNNRNKENKENTINISSLFANNAPVNVKVKLTQNQINQETMKSPEYIKLQSEFDKFKHLYDEASIDYANLLRRMKEPNVCKQTNACRIRKIKFEEALTYFLNTKHETLKKMKQLIQAKRDEEYFRNKVNTTNKVNTINTEKVTQVLGTSIPVAVIISILIALL